MKKSLPNQSISDSTPLWRYMDLDQFMSILERQALWFNQIKRYEDPFEGTLPDGLADDLGEVMRASMEEEGVDFEWMDTPLSEQIKSVQTYRNFIYTNCWHRNENQSDAMWKLYLSSDRGIAIQSKLNLIKKSIDSEFEIWYGNVEYLDWADAQGVIPPLPQILPLLKRRSFEHENEFRLLFIHNEALEQADEPLVEYDHEHTTPGEYISISVNDLIESVYISPKSPKWYGEIVAKIVDRYDLDVRIEYSGLYDSP